MALNPFVLSSLGFFFDMDHLKKAFICYNGVSVLCFGFLAMEICGILDSWPGIEPTLPALEGELLTTGPPGK